MLEFVSLTPTYADFFHSLAGGNDRQGYPNRSRSSRGRPWWKCNRVVAVRRIGMTGLSKCHSYQKRLSFLREIFRDPGFKGDGLEMRTRLFVCYHSWEMSMYGDESERKLARLQKLRIDLLAK